jgi:hypothetical protein
MCVAKEMSEDAQFQAAIVTNAAPFSRFGLRLAELCFLFLALPNL